MKAVLLSLICTSFAFAGAAQWEKMSNFDQYELLWDLNYAAKENLPSNTQSIDLLKDLSKHPELQEYYEKVLSKLESSKLSREAIEQSPYLTFGDEELIDFHVLVSGGKILGAHTYIYQDGREEDGSETDVNWGATLVFDSKGEFFTDEDGADLNDLRFEWSGY